MKTRFVLYVYFEKQIVQSWIAGTLAFVSDVRICTASLLVKIQHVHFAAKKSPRSFKFFNFFVPHIIFGLLTKNTQNPTT